MYGIRSLRFGRVSMPRAIGNEVADADFVTNYEQQAQWESRGRDVPIFWADNGDSPG
jgi:hypothetical protein